jgi:hypothetical protein
MRAFDAEPIAQVLSAAERATRLEIGPSLWGFGGVHGGLAMGLLTVAMRARAEGRVLRRISGELRRRLRGELALDVQDDGAGRSVSWLSARATVQGTTAVAATAVFATPGTPVVTPVATPMPPAPPALACAIYTVPRELVPFARRTEVRPIGVARPFSGAREPELAAWVRLVDDELPPDDARLVVLMDSLAPSLAAVLASPAPIPTVMFTVTPGSGLANASSPWVLLRARTAAAHADGWHLERLDAWAPDGAHLGSGEQLRLITPPR